MMKNILLCLFLSLLTTRVTSQQRRRGAVSIRAVGHTPTSAPKKGSKSSPSSSSSGGFNDGRVEIPAPAPVPVAAPTDVAIGGEEPPASVMNNETSTPTSSPTGVVAASIANDEDEAGTIFVPDSTVFCPGVLTDRRVEFWWEYSLVVDRANRTVSEVEDTIYFMEGELQDQLKERVLVCDDPLRNRRELAAAFGISGLDSTPYDEILEKECPDSDNGEQCYVVEGLMSLYLTSDADAEIAVLESRRIIRDIFSEAESLTMDADGVEKIAYLAPDLSDGASSATGSDTRAVSDEDPALGTGATVLVALGSVLLVVASATVYREHRRKHNNDIDGLDDKTDGPMTIHTASVMTGIVSANSSMTTPTDSDPSASTPRRSPFSEMLPPAYQTQGEPEETMSAILEDSDSASQSTTDIIVSECGYSTEDSRDASNLYTRDLDPILGAQRMDDYEQEDDDEEQQMDYLFDTGAMLNRSLSSEPTATTGVDNNSDKPIDAPPMMLSELTTPSKKLTAAGTEFNDQTSPEA